MEKILDQLVFHIRADVKRENRLGFFPAAVFFCGLNEGAGHFVGRSPNQS